MEPVGTLFLVATPIGNLEDLSLRAKRVLGEVSLIAAEDTRHTGRLLKHYEIMVPQVSYHEHNKGIRMDQVLEALERGDVALVSDAGSPGLSDPGQELVRAAWEAGHSVSPIPGPSAPIAALTASGLVSDRFLFLGYLPRERGRRRELLQARSRDTWAVVAFEVPHRVQDSLADLEEFFGQDREAALCRELTKLHEQILRGTLGHLRREVGRGTVAGEYTLVIAGTEADPIWDENTVHAAIRERVKEGQKPSAVAREVARLSGWKRREIYRLTLEES
jgi:16S rRNA (cytidine1402-2'-O)-methyltransferase